MRRVACGLALALLAACGERAAGPVPPLSQADAAKAFDEAIVRLNWAQVDLWKAGGRDVLVSVQLDTGLAPNYFRLPRRPSTP